MAVTSCTARVANHLAESALRLRQPARRVAGSVRSAVAIAAVIFAGYGLLIGSIFASTPWYRYGASCLVQTAAAFAFVMAIMDMALIFGVLVRKDHILHYILCAALALHAVIVPLSVCVIVGCAISGFFDMTLWEIPRLGACILQLGLMYCLLAELRGDPLPPIATLPSSDGWLKNNLAAAGLPPAPTSDEASLLKVLSDNDRPAVLTPSSCEQLHQQPPQVNINNSGPPSSSVA